MALVLSLGLVLGLAVPCAASAEPDNSLACELIAGSIVQKQLGVKHIKSSFSAESPTATGAGNQHTVEGADESECLYDGYDHKATKGELKALHNVRKPMPAGFGLLAISTYVRDDTPEGDGENWDPNQSAANQAVGLSADKKVFGGSYFNAPKLGSYIHNAAWLGSKDRTSGFYEIGETPSGSVITLSVNVPNGEGPAKFAALAKQIVPNFAQFTP
jgi:hypothetical protein